MDKKKQDGTDYAELTPPYWNYLARLIRPFPDFDFFFIKSLRQRAVAKLQLRPGDRVLDLGCGTGASFPYLLQAVTDSGLVVGVEISPDVVINARRRVQKHGWKNVQIIIANAQNLILSERFDAVLMMGAPDIYGSPSILANVVRHLQPRARFAAFGAKLSRHPQARPVNSIFRSCFSKATFASTPRLDFEPWGPLRDRSAAFNVEERACGLMFLAWGEMLTQDKPFT